MSGCLRCGKNTNRSAYCKDCHPIIVEEMKTKCSQKGGRECNQSDDLEPRSDTSSESAAVRRILSEAQEKGFQAQGTLSSRKSLRTPDADPDAYARADQ